MAAFWIVERTQDARFPFRIRIEQEGRVLLAVRTQDAWPGPGRQVFCLRDDAAHAHESLSPHEKVPIAHLARLGRKLSVTLDRAQRKRCEFLKIEKPRKDGSGSYEQIFFRTESAVRAHKSSKRTELVTHDALDIVIDSMERYPWRFPGAQLSRRKLPVGDYALQHHQRLVCMVERKTRENFLTDLSQLKGLEQQLAELAAYPHAALVIEAHYRDFGDPGHLGAWPAAHVQRVLAELPVLFPGLQIVYAGNRKLANLWTQRYFAAAAASLARPAPDSVREVTARYRGQAADGGLDTRIRVAALNEMPDPFPSRLLRQHFPDIPPSRIKRVLDQLRDEGRLATEGHGPGTRWRRLGSCRDTGNQSRP